MMGSMDVLLGVVLLVLGLICWGGQVFSWLWPETAARLGLTEGEAAVEPVFWVDTRAEAACDSLVVWTLPLAGLLLLLNVSAWAYLGLLGGGIYLYFSGRGIFQRLAMQQRGMRIGFRRERSGRHRLPHPVGCRRPSRHCYSHLRPLDLLRDRSPEQPRSNPRHHFGAHGRQVDMGTVRPPGSGGEDARRRCRLCMSRISSRPLPGTGSRPTPPGVVRCRCRRRRQG